MNEPAAMDAMELRDVRLRYDRRAPLTLQGLELTVQPGTVTAILGPNGCGKTMLLLVLLGRLRPLARDVRLGGQTATSPAGP